MLNFRKNLDIKFPWEEGPYVVKSRVALPIINNLLISMGFSLGVAINYDPHQVIYKIREANKNKPFEHTEVDGLREAANWEDYANKAPDNINMGQDLVSSIPGNNSSPMDLSNIVAVAGNISSLISFSGNSKKREHSGFMEIEEAATASTPKKRKIGQGQMVHVKKSSVKGKQKKGKCKATFLELQEYVFDRVTPSKYTSKE